MARSVPSRGSKTTSKDKGLKDLANFEAHRSLLRDDKTGRLKKASSASVTQEPRSSSARLLKELRQEAGLSVRRMAEELGMKPATYQHYEDRYKKAFLPFDVLDLVEPVLIASGVSKERVEGLSPQISNIVDDVSGILKAPLISWVQAGALEEAFDPYTLGGFEDEVLVEYERDSVIALRVKGTSINRVAPDGAVIIIDYSLQELLPEKFFVIRVGGEATVKRFMKQPDRFEPFSTEPDHPIILPTEDLHVVGRVVRVVTAL
jgi:SOS-response transcriptional repressor LexA